MVFYSSSGVAERLNFLWSSLILLVFALFVGALRFLFLPSLISCWTPAQFENSHNLFTLQTCWNQNISYLPLDHSVPNHGYRPEHITYHSFIPVVVVFLIIGFKIPEAIKVLLDMFTGSKPMSLSTSTYSWEERSESLAEYGRDIVQRSGIVKTLSFFLVKILILANLLLQFIFVRSYFRDSVSRVENDGSFTEVQHNIMFPKVILCDFLIRQQGRVQRYTVQCEMPVNQLYQEFFRIYSFWILCIGFFTIAITLFQIGTLMIPSLVGIRYRGIIPEKELKLRGFSVDDALLFLEEVKDEFGVAMARSVASKMWSTPISMKQRNGGSEQPIIVGGDSFQEIPMTTTENGAADSSHSQLIDNTKQEKTENV